MKKETADIKLVKYALLGQSAYPYANNPALTVISDQAAQDTARYNSRGMSPAKPTAAQTMTNAMDQAGIERGTVQPSYMDVIKDKANDAWKWTKGQWNALPEDIRTGLKDTGSALGGAYAMYGLANMIPGIRNSRLARMLAYVGGGIGGFALNRYLQNPENRQNLVTKYNSVKSKLLG